MGGGDDSSEATEAEAGWPLRLLPLPCGSWRMRSLLRWLINQFQLLVEQCSQSLKLTQYASKGQIIAKRIGKRGVLKFYYRERPGSGLAAAAGHGKR